MGGDVESKRDRSTKIKAEMKGKKRGEGNWNGEDICIHVVLIPVRPMVALRNPAYFSLGLKMKAQCYS